MRKARRSSTRNQRRVFSTRRHFPYGPVLRQLTVVVLMLAAAAGIAVLLNQLPQQVDIMLLLGKAIDYVFIGSCTNARIEDLRQVADFVKGKRKAAGVEVWIVPGSMQVAKQAQAEGLDQIFEEAGFELRGPGWQDLGTRGKVLLTAAGV